MSHMKEEALRGWKIILPDTKMDGGMLAANPQWPEYPGAESWPARDGFASQRGGKKVTHITIHAMWGSYEGSLQWFQSASNPYYTSAHYSVSKTGRVGQSVWEHLAAHHVGVHNGYTIGVEHEDNQQMNSPGWVTDKMLHASAKLVAHLCKKYRIPIDRAHIRGHWEFSGQDHTDPGKHWPWATYIALIKKYSGVPENPIAPTALYRVNIPAHQVGAFKTEANAKNLIKSAAGLGVTATYAKSDGLFKVSVAKQRQGSYGVQANAQGTVNRLKGLGIKSAIEAVSGPPAPPVKPPAKKVVVPKVDYNQWYPRPAGSIKEIVTTFGVYADTYDGHGTTGRPYGADFWISRLGVRANASQEAFGDSIQRYVERNWVRLGVHYMIYWGWQNWGSGWSWYDPSVYGRGALNSVTQGHFDHLHIQFYG